MCQCPSGPSVDLPTHSHRHARPKQGTGVGWSRWRAQTKTGTRQDDASAGRRGFTRREEGNGESGSILGLSTRAFLTTGLAARCKGECGVRAVDTAEERGWALASTQQKGHEKGREGGGRWAPGTWGAREARVAVVCVCVVLVLAVVVGGGGCCDGSGGGGVGVGRGCMRCSRLRYATLRCTALLLWCSGALVLCDVRRSEAMGCKGRQRQRRGQRTAPGTRTRDAAKTPIRPRDAIVRKQVSTADAPPAMRGTVNTQCVLRIHLAAAAITTHTSSL